MAERTKDALARHDVELAETKQDIAEIKEIVGDLLIALVDMPQPEPVIETEPEEFIPRDSATGAQVSDPAVLTHEAYVQRTYGRDNGSQRYEVRKAGLPKGLIRDPFGQIRVEIEPGKWGPAVNLNDDGYVEAPSLFTRPEDIVFDDSDSLSRQQALREKRASPQRPLVSHHEEDD